jgi:hypothetical protein
MIELYLHSFIRLHGIVHNYLSADKFVFIFLPYFLRECNFDLFVWFQKYFNFFIVSK